MNKLIILLLFNQVNYLILAKAKFQYWLIVIYIRRHNRFSNFIHPIYNGLAHIYIMVLLSN